MPARKKTAKRAAPSTSAPAPLRRHKMEGMEQVRALSHPLRLKLLEVFATAPMTTKQAAEELREAPTRLYHHVAALERAGLIRLKETRQNRGTTEKYFEAVAARFEGSAHAVGAGRKDLTSRHVALGMILFDQARAELVRALASRRRGGEGHAHEANDPLVAVRGVLCMTPAATKRLVRELQALLDSFRGREKTEQTASSSPDARRYSLTIALIPTDDL